MRRLLAVLLGVVVVIGGLVLLAVAFSSRDSGELEVPADQAGPGELEPDRGRAHQQVATRELRLSPSPPTSGPHPASNITQEGEVDDRAIIHALEQGNVVIVHPGAKPPAELRALQEAVSGPFDPELAAAGQTVILVARPRASAIQALAWRRRLRAETPSDPRLREFAEAWLGKGAP